MPQANSSAPFHKPPMQHSVSTKPNESAKKQVALPTAYLGVRAWDLKFAFLSTFDSDTRTAPNENIKGLGYRGIKLWKSYEARGM